MEITECLTVTEEGQDLVRDPSSTKHLLSSGSNSTPLRLWDSQSFQGNPEGIVEKTEDSQGTRPHTFKEGSISKRQGRWMPHTVNLGQLRGGHRIQQVEGWWDQFHCHDAGRSWKATEEWVKEPEDWHIVIWIAFRKFGCERQRRVNLVTDTLYGNEYFHLI